MLMSNPSHIDFAVQKQYGPALGRVFCASFAKVRLKICILLSALALTEYATKYVARRRVRFKANKSYIVN